MQQRERLPLPIEREALFLMWLIIISKGVEQFVACTSQQEQSSVSSSETVPVELCRHTDKMCRDHVFEHKRKGAYSWLDGHIHRAALQGQSLWCQRGCPETNDGFRTADARQAS